MVPECFLKATLHKPQIWECFFGNSVFRFRIYELIGTVLGKVEVLPGMWKSFLGRKSFRVCGSPSWALILKGISLKKWVQNGPLFRPGIDPLIKPKGPFSHHRVEIGFFGPPALLTWSRHRFWTDLFLPKGGRCKIPFGGHFRPIGWQALFSTPPALSLGADIGFEQTCFFQKGVDARAHLGIILATSVGKCFFSATSFIT